MNILRKIKPNFSLKYYGCSDDASGIYASILIENNDLIFNYYDKNEKVINSEDSLIDFIVINTIIKYEEMVEFSKNEESKHKLIALVDRAKTIFALYDNVDSEIYSLINKKYIDIFNTKESQLYIFELVEIMTDYVFTKYWVISLENFDFIEKYNYFYIFNNIDKCTPFYIKNTDRFDNLLNKIYLEGKNSGNINLINFLMLDVKKKLNDIFKKYVILILENSLILFKNINVDNIMRLYFIYEKCLELAEKFGIEKYVKKYEMIKPKFEENTNKHLKQYGKEFKFDIPVDKLKEDLKNDLNQENSFKDIAFLQLTHILPGNGNSFRPSILEVFKKPREVLYDKANHIGLTVNNEFTASVQKKLQLNLLFEVTNLSNILKDLDLGQEFFKTISDVMTNVCIEFNLDDKDFDLELNGIIDLLFYLMSIDIDYPYYTTLCYSISQNICSFIEKFLRKLIIINQEEDNFTLESNLTLGAILNNEMLAELLGKDLVLFLKYKLIQIVEQEKGNTKRIGENLRNRLMHNYDIDYTKDLNEYLVFTLFYILVLIINQLEVLIINKRTNV